MRRLRARIRWRWRSRYRRTWCDRLSGDASPAPLRAIAATSIVRPRLSVCGRSSAAGAIAGGACAAGGDLAAVPILRGSGAGAAGLIAAGAFGAAAGGDGAAALFTILAL
jgi:hypothetical protein